MYTQRKEGLLSYDLTPAFSEKSGDDITRLAAFVCDAPVAFISIHAKKFFFLSEYGLGTYKGGDAFGKFVMEQPGRLCIIEDAALDTRVKEHPWFLNRKKVLSYAAAPLLNSDECMLGTLSVLDTKPRSFTPQQTDSLKALAGQVVQLLELRKSKLELNETRLTLSRESERLNNIIEGIQVGTWEWHVQKDEIHINDRWAELIGYTKEELEPITLDTYYKVIHPDDVSLSDQKIQECFKREAESYDIECRMLHKDGHIVWINDKGRVVSWTKDGKPLIMAGTHTDITTTKHARDRLQHSEQRFKALVQDGSDLVTILDVEGNYLYASPTSTAILGVPPERFIGRNAFDFIHEDDREAVLANFKKLKSQKRIAIAPFRFIKKDGKWRWIETIITNLLKDPAVGGIVANSRDVTERIEVEQALKESNERFEYVNKATNDAIYDWDIKNDKFHWGEGFLRIFKHKEKKGPFRLKDWLALMHPGDRDKNKEHWLNFMADKQQYRWHEEFRFKRAGGDYLHVEDIGHLIRDTKGNPQRMIGVLRDITEAKQLDIRNEMQREVAQIFKKEDNLDDILRNVLQYLCEFGEFNMAEIWLKSNDEMNLNLTAVHAGDKKAQRFSRESREERKMLKGKSLPGSVWKKGTLEIWNNIASRKTFLRNKAAKSSGLNAACGIPLFHNYSPIGVLVLFSDRSMQNTQVLKPFEVLQHFLGGEIQRKKQEEEMYLLFQSAPEILAIATPHGYFSKVNPAFCEILGYTQEELTTQPFMNFIHPDDLKNTRQEYRETIKGSRRAQNFLNRYRTKSGAYRWISWSSSDMFGEDKLMFSFGRDVTEIIKLQNLLDRASNLARVGSWEIDVIKGTVFWSDITKEIREAASDFVPTLSEGIGRFVKGHDRDTITKRVKDCKEKGIPWDEELQIVTFKGNVKWIRTIGEAEFIQGKCIRIYGSFQDIHKQKIAEIELQKALEERNNILESIGDAFFALDNKFTVTYWNNLAEKLLHTPKNKIVGKHLWDLFPDAVNLPSYKNYHRVMKEKVTITFEDYYEPVGKWFEVSAYPAGEGITVYFKDITDRKHSEEQIRQSNERFEKIAEATNDAIWDFDIVENTLFWGKGFTTLFGHDLKKVSPRFELLVNYIHPADRNEVMRKIKAFMADPKAINWFAEYRFLKSDGSYAFIIDRGIFIRDEKGRPLRAVGAITDITYRKEYEDSLRSLNEQIGKRARELAISNAELEQFAYVASHDLQEPLRMVSSFLTQLERKYGDSLDEKAHEYIHFAVDGAHRMRQIILDLLEFSQVGKYEDKLQEVSLNEVVEEVMQILHRKINARNAKIHYLNLPIIPAFKTPLIQIFQNLISNAIKYTATGVQPVVKIKAKERKEDWLLSVQDNGIGISKEYFDKIFLIFQRLHGKREYDGTGMGLAIVKKNIDNLGGQVWVESEEGKGSVFYFTLKKH